MSRFAQIRWIFVLAVGLFCLHCVPAEATAAVTICNEGEVTIKTAAAEVSNPLFSGTTYYVRGWFDVESGTCSHVLNTGYSDGLYLGFAYPDARSVLRTHISVPRGRNTDFSPTSHRLCVAMGESFEYETTAMDTSCPTGKSALEFSLYVDLSKLGPIGVTYTVRPSRDEGGDVLGGLVVGARLLEGGELIFVGNEWQLSTGTPIPKSYVSSEKPMPPLAPRVQFSPAQQPVAGYLKQIEGVIAGTAACRKTASVDYKQMYLKVSERGVAHSVYDDSKHAAGDWMVMGDMDFSKASIKQVGGGIPGECWTLEISCKADGFRNCGERDHSLLDGTQIGVFDIYTNTRDQAARILDALRRIAPSYPDAKPEFRRIQ